jgi:hypothetical protein
MRLVALLKRLQARPHILRRREQRGRRHSGVWRRPAPEQPQQRAVTVPRQAASISHLWPLLAIRHQRSMDGKICAMLLMLMVPCSRPHHGFTSGPG